MSYGPITPKQQEILDYMKAQVRAKGYPPSVREICEAVSLKSTSSVHAHLSSLEKNGYIHRDPTKPRAIEIVDENEPDLFTETVSVPVIGRVAAGEPIFAEQNIEEYFPLPAGYITGTDRVFALRVHGDSMVNIGILDGDQVFVREAHTARNGEVVVALVEDSATVKRFYKENGHYRLQPENDFMDPIIVDHCEVLGTVIGVFRYLA